MVHREWHSSPLLIQTHVFHFLLIPEFASAAFITSRCSASVHIYSISIHQRETSQTCDSLLHLASESSCPVVFDILFTLVNSENNLVSLESYFRVILKPGNDQGERGSTLELWRQTEYCDTSLS